MTNAPIIIDIEASGIGPEGYPIEIGFTLVDDRIFDRRSLSHRTGACWNEKKEEIRRETATNRHRKSPDTLVIQMTYYRTQVLTSLLSGCQKHSPICPADSQSAVFLPTPQSRIGRSVIWFP